MRCQDELALSSIDPPVVSYMHRAFLSCTQYLPTGLGLLATTSRADPGSDSVCTTTAERSKDGTGQKDEARREVGEEKQSDSVRETLTSRNRRGRGRWGMSPIYAAMRLLVESGSV